MRQAMWILSGAALVFGLAWSGLAQPAAAPPGGVGGQEVVVFQETFDKADALNGWTPSEEGDNRKSFLVQNGRLVLTHGPQDNNISLPPLGLASLVDATIEASFGVTGELKPPYSLLKVRFFDNPTILFMHAESVSAEGVGVRISARDGADLGPIQRDQTYTLQLRFTREGTLLCSLAGPGIETPRTAKLFCPADAPTEITFGNVVGAAVGGMFVDRVAVRQVQKPRPEVADVVVSWEGRPAGSAAAAAAKMALYLSRVTGQEALSVAWREQKARDTLVLMTAEQAPAGIAERLRPARLDAFVIQYPVTLDGRKVCLLVARDLQGVDFPVYYFLRKFAGIEWVGPDPLGEIVTEQRGWRLPERIDVFENPDYEHRLWSDPGFNPRRWLAGSARLPFHHNLWSVFDPAKFGDQPDLYPFYDGKRNVPDPKDPHKRGSGWQPCTGNPKAVRIAADYGIQHLKENPHQRSFSLSINDGGTGNCLCDLCRAQDAKAAFDYGAPFLTDRFTRFNNAVLEEVTRVNPDAYLGVLGYGRCKQPPVEAKIHPRTLIFNVCDNTSPEPDALKRQEEWKKAGGLPCLYQWQWDGGYLTVRHYPHAVADIVRASHALGGMGYYCEDITAWAAGGPRFYVLAHVLWNTKTNTDEALDRYMGLSFGPEAGPAVRAYYDRWEQVWERGGKEIRHNTGRDWMNVTQLKDLTRDDLAAMDKALERAAAARMTPDQKARLDYVRAYYQWLRVNADQYLVTRDLCDEAWVSSRTPEQVMAEVERGTGLTEEFERLWKTSISTDRTGWLLSAREHAKPDEYWKRMVAPIRAGVLAAYEPALDRAGDALTRQMLKARTKEQAADFWTDLSGKNPRFAAWARTQANLLRKGPGPNLVPNPDFEKGEDGAPPSIQGWRSSGSWSGIPADFGWQPDSGRNGGRAAAVGRGYTASLSASVPTVQGARYRVSVWHKSNALRPRVRAAAGPVGLALNPVRNEWRQAVTTFTSPANGVVITLGADGLNRGEWAWFDDVEVVEICPK